MVTVAPMEKLLVATFRGDPEFEAIEPQVFNDPVNGTGMRVLRYRKDGTVDVYWQPGGACRSQHLCHWRRHRRLC
jgi:hypothetical protein